MDSEEYRIMYQVEDSLWWYKGMQAISRAALERVYKRGQGLRILDAGCGTGACMQYLADYGCVTGLDFSPYALQFSQQRGAKRLLRGSVTALPFEPESFDLVTSFDVLCVTTVHDDVALQEFERVLVSGGRVLLRLPANNWLRGAHDRAVDIAHRYSAGEVKAKVEQAGLWVEHVSYANMWLFPVALLKRWSERIFPPQEGSDLTLGMGRLNGIFRAILSSEAPLVAKHSLPVGLTVLAVARKP